MINKINKLNYVYWNSLSFCSSYQLEEGMMRELMRVGILHLCVDLSTRRFDEHYEQAEFERYPILVCDGWYPHMDRVFDSIKKRNMIQIETESKYLTSGERYEMYDRQKMIADKSLKIFTHCELDCADYFGHKAEFLPIFIDTELYQERDHIQSDEILLAGNLYSGRKEIFDIYERMRIMTQANTPYRQSALLQSIDHATLISRWRFIWSPSTKSRTFGGKWAQGAACKRLVFIEHTDNCPLMESIVQDRVHAVYYKHHSELPGLRDYYLKNPEEYLEIVENAYKLVHERFTTRAAVKQIISSLKKDGILDESTNED